MNELVKSNVKNLIYNIRGKEVMLDSDLANLYNVETKRINEAVKNNPQKFPERYSWVLEESEWKFLRSKFSTLEINVGPGKYRKYLPRVFTEQGVAMLATILKSNNAINISIQIMDAFVEMRHFISSELIEERNIKKMVLEHENKINTLQNIFLNFDKKDNENTIFYDGQIYDAYSKILDILNKGKEEIIIIDNYADKNLLDIIRKINIKIKIITKKNNLLKEIDIKKYNEQYNNLKVYFDESFHDRYILIDKKILYHCGTSLNHIGKKTFSINKISDNDLVNDFLNHITSKFN